MAKLAKACVICIPRVMHRFFAVFFAFAAVLPLAAQDVEFRQNGVDLEVEFLNTIQFTVNAATTSGEFGFVFEDVIDPAPSIRHGSQPGAGSNITMTINGVTTPMSYDVWSDWRDGPLNEIDNTDFYGSFFAAAPQSVINGSIVTINPGVAIIVGYFQNPPVALPENASTIVLTNSGFAAISDPLTITSNSITVVPEPAAASVLFAAIAWLVARRRSCR